MIHGPQSAIHPFTSRTYKLLHIPTHFHTHPSIYGYAEILIFFNLRKRLLAVTGRYWVTGNIADVILVSEDTQWILTWTTQRLPEAEGRGRSMWRVLQGRSRVLVAASAWWARVTFVLLSELDGLPVGFLNLVEHLQQESVVTIARHPFWRQNLNQTKNISGAQELTPFHFRGPSPFGGKLFPWEILDWAGFRNQLMLMHPELGERHNLYCFKS